MRKLSSVVASSHRFTTSQANKPYVAPVAMCSARMPGSCPHQYKPGKCSACSGFPIGSIPRHSATTVPEDAEHETALRIRPQDIAASVQAKRAARLKHHPWKTRRSDTTEGQS
jgi:hypothetical protein